MTPLPIIEQRIAYQIIFAGNVQGIGYRPTLARLAQNLSLSGWVANSSAGVEVYIEGPTAEVETFVDRSARECPIHGRLREVRATPLQPAGVTGFEIRNSQPRKTVATQVPPDMVACSHCLTEVSLLENRRYQYHLTSCCSCGPRYTIIDQMPYDREQTTLASYRICNACACEYESPGDRRFHAQTISCAQCGPNYVNEPEAVPCLKSGGILAILGVGGFQLLVDATNPEAIAKLRERKGRPTKPFAVMVRNDVAAEAIVLLTVADRQALGSTSGPIVIARRRQNSLPSVLAPGLGTLGVMLPTTPLHAWLARDCGPLVVTSANVEGNPLMFEASQATFDLPSLADAVVTHDRPIRRSIDDSVVRIVHGKQLTIRLARGLAPLPIDIQLGPSNTAQQPHILALGGHQKVAIAFSNGNQAVLGPHLGDLDSVASRHRFEQHIFDMLRLYKVRPALVVHDEHPDYFTSTWAADYCRKNSVRRMLVQHHHAHTMAGVVDSNPQGQAVLGVAWDGTGLGSDGTVWGGEFLIASSTTFTRFGCLRPFRLPGGEAAVREPWRVLVAMMDQVRSWKPSLTYSLEGDDKLHPILNHPQFSPLSTSAGRLFDAIAALIHPDPNVRHGSADYEGHFACLLEDLCDRQAVGNYPLPLVEFRASDDPASVTRWLDWRPLIHAIVLDRQRSLNPGGIAMRFHRSLALGIRKMCDLQTDLPVVLGGGVFQNKLLVELISEEFANAPQRLIVPSAIPINDGGLAAGQLAIAAARLKEERTCA